jgi:COX assembly protein 2
MFNAAERRVRECSRAERLEGTRKNREVARDREKKMEEKWAEIDRDS